METCAICLDTDSEKLKWRDLPCGHGYHAGCLMAWLAHESHCPLCRAPLLVEMYLRIESSPEPCRRAAFIPPRRPGRGAACFRVAAVLVAGAAAAVGALTFI